MLVAEYLERISTLDIDILYCKNLNERYEIFKNEVIDIILVNLFLSDGYPDQFGCPNGKKFMTRNVAEMLRNIAHLMIIEQEKVI